MKRFLVFLLAAMVVCGCNQTQPVINSQSASPKQEISTVAPQEEPYENTKPEMEFKVPDLEYKILAELPIKEGYAIVYEQMMSDEFNKRFSSDTVFWGLYMQLFDQQGKRIETVDFDRHNSYRIPTPVTQLKVEDNYIYFESRHTIEQGPGMPDYQMDYCFYLALNAKGIDEIKPYQLGDRYRMRSYYVLVDKDGVSLQYGTQYDEKHNIDRSVFRLVGENYGESKIVLEEIDASVISGISDIIYGSDIYGNPAEYDGLYSVSVDFDPHTSQAVIKNQKITLELDFAKGIATEHRQYTEEMLEQLFAVSPDGKTELWAAGLNPYFEGPTGCDFVLKNKDGELKYLCGGVTLHQAEFIDNDRLLIMAMDNMTVFDALTGEEHEKQIAFDFGSIKHPENPKLADVVKWVVVGIKVDANGNLIVAHRSNADRDDKETAVMLAVYDNDGQHIKTVDSGLRMMPYGKFVANIIEITADGETAVLKINGSEKEMITIDYITRS